MEEMKKEQIPQIGSRLRQHITYTPPSTQELFKELMAKYRT